MEARSVAQVTRVRNLRDSAVLHRESYTPSTPPPRPLSKGAADAWKAGWQPTDRGLHPTPPVFVGGVLLGPIHWRVVQRHLQW